MNSAENFKSILITFLETGNDTDLALMIDQYPELILPVNASDAPYPDQHRIMDICIKGQHYRVCRQISLGEKLSLKLIDKTLSAPDLPGVPLWLTGEKLKLWARFEETNDSDDPTDWGAYR